MGVGLGGQGQNCGIRVTGKVYMQLAGCTGKEKAFESKGEMRDGDTARR